MIQMIICGRGGQGIVFLTRLLGDIATEKGLEVISSETHGMAVRGGSINSHLKIGPFFSPLIGWGHADYLISLDSSETANNKHFLKPGGVIFENSPDYCESFVYRVDAARIARSLGRIQLENVVLLGFAASLANLEISLEEIRKRIDSEVRQAVREKNLAALESGLKAAATLKD
ncbi:MAG: 2-oxoacid:acceptor oxidoreductase family protein [Deltaproteobacteria bacterium]|nr:2-oxoacid:acceptor oxidoreductase family protein [Deltaproteobacteria bacterium]